MQRAIILNNREIKKILKQLEYFGFEGRLNYAFLKKKDGKLYILDRKFGEIDTKNLRINNLGLYFGKEENSGIRLSIEGSQLIRPDKNVIELDEKQVKQWMHGKDIAMQTEEQGIKAIKSGKDFFGCGILKQNKLLNFVPKNRRLTTKKIE